MMPPYVIYKGENCYPAWGQNGPPGARYTATASGWLTTYCFRDWFENLALPLMKRLVGKKVLVGDNLVTHMSAEVIKQCKDNDIDFVCLPPNSTDKTQPLDVGIFGPMKNSWRNMLRGYRKQDPGAKLLQKTAFPRMLRELMETLEPEVLLPAVGVK